MKKVFQVRERTIPSHEVEKKGKEKSSNMNHCDLGVSKGKNKPYCKEQCPCGMKQNHRIKQKALHATRSFLSKIRFSPQSSV
jgi:hypothetical protein